MNKTTIVVLSLTGALCTGTAGANGFYLGGDLMRADYEEPGLPSINPTLLVLRGGNRFNDHFAIEARVGFGVTDDDVVVSVPELGMTVPVTLEIDQLTGLYAIGFLPLGGMFDIYALAGFSSIKATARANGFSESDTESDLSLGVGFKYHFTRNLSMHAEWAQLLDKDVFEVSAVSLGLSWAF